MTKVPSGRLGEASLDRLQHAAQVERPQCGLELVGAGHDADASRWSNSFSWPCRWAGCPTGLVSSSPSFSVPTASIPFIVR